MKHISIVALIAAAFALAANEPAGAVVYCKTVGVPQGCVARTAVRPVAHPVARTAGRAAVGVGVNAGGPVNRRGIR